jgi:hypothetical protein
MKKSQRLQLLKTVYTKWLSAQENDIILDDDMVELGNETYIPNVEDDFFNPVDYHVMRLNANMSIY